MTQDLIERVLAGDEAAARELHDAHYPVVLRLAYMLLQNLQDAEDATQDAFIYAFHHLARYDPKPTPSRPAPPAATRVQVALFTRVSRHWI